MMNEKTDKLSFLYKYFGYSSFRSGQEKIIDDILSGKDVLVVMPTGAGKSVCFQLPALMSGGTTIVISPLISLMKDQIYSLRENGISAATINSSLDSKQMERVYKSAENGKYKILYVSPERLNTPLFSALVQKIDIPFVCVDEAHCVSQWGQDFRSSYLEISEFISKLNKRPVVAAFTATATGIVRDDICRLLKLQNPEITVSGFDRKNLFFEVQKPEDKFTALRSCLDSHSSKSCIVYCSTRKTVEEVCERLKNLGYNASRYHAGLLQDERRHNQEMFVNDKVKIMIATNAFGMGIDKSDVSLVVHYNMPGDIESYYQEAGRAGRDGSDADCILLYSYQDVKIQEFFINNQSDNEYISEKDREKFKKRRLEMLRCMQSYCNTELCLRNIILRYFGEKSGGKCNNCSVCSGVKKYTDITVDSQKVLSAVARTNGICTEESLLSLLHADSEEYLNIKTYGAMKESNKDYISSVINCLIENEYVFVDSFSKKLSLSVKSKDILFGGMRLKMKDIGFLSHKGEKSSEISDKPDLVLFTALKVLRKEIALKLSIPPLAVFTDAVLRQMSAVKPLDYTSMRNISGMSAGKLEKYAPIFLKEINAYVKNENIN